MKISFGPSIDRAPQGYLRVRLTEEEKGTTRVVREKRGTQTTDWLEIGTGKRADVTQRKFIVLVRAIVNAAKQQKAKKIAIQLDQSPFPKLNGLALPELGSLIAQNLV